MPPKKEKAAKNGGAQLERRGARRVLHRAILLLLVFALTAGAVWAAWELGQEHFFRANPRFTLKNIVVESTGYWGLTPESQRQLRNILMGKLKKDAKKSVVTLYSSNLGDLRSYLEQIPNVERAEVERQLPANLVVHLVERTPRAYVNEFRSALVVDDYGRLMDSRFCLIGNGDLPVIETSLSWSLADNDHPEKTEILKPALELLATARLRFPELRILRVSAVDPESVRFSMTFRDGQKIYTVLMKPGNFDRYLMYLSNACDQAIQTGMTKATVNMLYDVGVTWQ